MNILTRILDHKGAEVEQNKRLLPAKTLEKSVHFSRRGVSLKETLLANGQSGIIAEIKRRSPSRGVINPNVSIEKISCGYVQAGASALSILTDGHFFGGSSDDLSTARKLNSCPILRKDFIIDEYQILEAKAIGADVILLIAAALKPAELKTLCTFAHNLGLEVLMEVHDEEELKNNADGGADLVGVNNRNLRTFELNIETSKQLSRLIPDSVVKISESGIESPEVIVDLKGYGYQGFLVGQTFMQDQQPEKAAKEFIDKLRRLGKDK